MDAIVYCENEFGKIDGKVANGLVRHSEKYNIVGVIDSKNSGIDAGECIDGIKNGIPIFYSIDDAISNLKSKSSRIFEFDICPVWGTNFIIQQLF